MAQVGETVASRCASRGASCRLVLVCSSATGKNRELFEKFENTTFLEKIGRSSLHHFGDFKNVGKLGLDKTGPNCPLEGAKCIPVFI